MMEEGLILTIFSNICQITATIISIYLAVFIFFWNYLVNNGKKNKNTDPKKTAVFTFLICLVLIVVNYYFVFPSYELGIYAYLPLFLILGYAFLLIWHFVNQKSIAIIEKGLLILSTVFALTAFILGFYLIISCISSMPSVGVLLDSYVYKIIKMARMFFVLILDSLVFLILFTLIHKLFIFRKK